MSAQTRSRRRLLTPILLGLILAISALALPSAALQPAQSALIASPRATAVDTEPDIVWVLAAGSDARPGEVVTRARADALHLIAIDARTGAASMVGIPRDSYVSIPGIGGNRINAAMYFGGPDLLRRAVENLFDVRIDYVFVSSFGSFKTMIDSIGGITLNNPRFFADDKLKATGFKKGQITLGGYTALQFSRIRKSLPGGDFDRSANQNLVIEAIQAKMRRLASRNGWLEGQLLTAMRAMSSTASPAEMYRLTHAVASLNPKKFRMCVLRGGFATIGGASVVTPSVSDARRYVDEARDDARIRRC